MAHTEVQWAFGTSAILAAYTGPAREVTVNTDDFSLVVQDGVTAGGKTRLTPGIIAPQGRLTGDTGQAAVQITDNAAITTLYYVPYSGQWAPLYNGTVWTQVNIGNSISLALDSNSGHTGYQASGSLFDLFIFNNGGTLAIGTGPAWSTLTSRGTGVGTTQISLLNGIWTNAVAITLRFGNASGNTVSVTANQATYLGTMLASANGQTSMVFKPSGASGGNNTVLGLFNAYNRVRVASRSMDSTGSWAYTTTAWRAANNSVANRIGYVDGLGQSFAEAIYIQSINGSGNLASIGIAFDGTGAPTGNSGAINPTAGSFGMATVARDHLASLGFHYAQAVEYGGTGNTFMGNGSQLLELTTDV